LLRAIIVYFAELADEDAFLAVEMTGVWDGAMPT